ERRRAHGPGDRRRDPGPGLPGDRLPGPRPNHAVATGSATARRLGSRMEAGWPPVDPTRVAPNWEPSSTEAPQGPQTAALPPAPPVPAAAQPHEAPPAMI